MRAAKQAAAVFGLLAWIGIQQPALAQSSLIDSGVISESKFGFYWETRMTPPTPPLADTFSTAAAYSLGVVHRVMVDRAQRVYLGYDVVVEPLAETNTYRVAFRKLTLTPELEKQFLGDSPSSWRQVPTPGWGLPAPQSIRGGDVLELSLLINGRSGQRVTDYVTVQEPSRKFSGFESIPARTFAFAPGPARDFRADDVELSIQSPRLSINGNLDESTARRYDEVSGSLVWFHTAKRGRFILSLVPHPKLGFKKAGEVRGSSLSFVIGNDMFTLSTGSRIAPGKAAFTLYVLHDPNWRPTYPDADVSAFIMGAADRAESLVRK